jgi:hypothetical protein
LLALPMMISMTAIPAAAETEEEQTIVNVGQSEGKTKISEEVVPESEIEEPYTARKAGLSIVVPAVQI